MSNAIAVVSDLLFSSKILGTARELGIAARCVTRAADLERELGASEVGLVMVDMELAGGEAAAVLRCAARHVSAPTTLAFYPHVQSDLKEVARQAGAGLILPRSKFSQDLPSLLATYCTESG